MMKLRRPTSELSLVRGSTTIVPIELEDEFDLSATENVRMSFSQCHENIVIKTGSDILIDDEANIIQTTLSQEETLLFDERYPVYLQIKGLIGENAIWVSDFITIDVLDVADEVVMK